VEGQRKGWRLRKGRVVGGGREGWWWGGGHLLAIGAHYAQATAILISRSGHTAGGWMVRACVCIGDCVPPGSWGCDDAGEGRGDGRQRRRSSGCRDGGCCQGACGMLWLAFWLRSGGEACSATTTARSAFIYGLLTEAAPLRVHRSWAAELLCQELANARSKNPCS